MRIEGIEPTRGKAERFTVSPISLVVYIRIIVYKHSRLSHGIYKTRLHLVGWATLIPVSGFEPEIIGYGPIALTLWLYWFTKTNY